jgi:hypothetical protein
MMVADEAVPGGVDAVCRYTAENASGLSGWRLVPPYCVENTKFVGSPALLLLQVSNIILVTSSQQAPIHASAPRVWAARLVAKSNQVAADH